MEVLAGLIHIFLLLTLISIAQLAPRRTFETEEVMPWYDLTMRRFYGPWSILVKKNGDHIDYSDYGAPVPNFRLDSIDLTYGKAITKNYPEDALSNYADVLPEFNSIYGISPIGLAVFRTGIRTGETLDSYDYDNDYEIDATTPSTQEDYSVPPQIHD